MVALSPLSTQPVVHAGQFIVGAQMSFYDAGTLTPRTVWKDAAQNNAWDQPILSDANGCWPTIFTAGNPLKAVMKLPGGAAYREIDGIPADVATGGGGGGGGGGSTTLETGDVLAAYRTGPRAGYVRCNSRTIGNASSGATERANADTSALFVFLWSQDSSLPVSGGRGVSGSADFSAGKTIQLPDVKGRSITGLDDMGDAPAGRLSGVIFSSGSATTLGSTGGTATKALTSANNGPHTHTGTTSTNGNHQHSGTTAGAGSHSHTASSDGQGSHSHPNSFTGTDGDHNHSLTVPVTRTGVAGSGSDQTLYWKGTTSDVTGTSGAHYHGVFLSTDGYHSHNITVNAGGAHTHTFLCDAAGSHQHIFTTDTSGTGTAFDAMTPFVLVTIYIKL